MPAAVRDALKANRLESAYRARPPYQRNDYLMWIGEAKRPETRERRIAQMLSELRKGGVYMKTEVARGTPAEPARYPLGLMSPNPPPGRPHEAADRALREECDALLESMQGARARRAIEALFRASPLALGKAALAGARKASRSRSLG